MEAYADGDDSAFGALYDALAPRLFGLLLKQTGDRSRAEDLVQETMLALHRSRGQFTRGADVLPWAFAIGRRLCIDRFRRQKIEDGFARDQAAGLDGTDSSGRADDELHARHLAQKVEATLQRLPESQRTAFELIRTEGLSPAQAAEALGTTVPAVKLRAHRAYERLRAEIGVATEGDAP